MVKRRVRRPFHRARAVADASRRRLLKYGGQRPPSPLSRFRGGGSKSGHALTSRVIARHCEERSDEAIQCGRCAGLGGRRFCIAALDCFASLAMTKVRTIEREAERRQTRIQPSAPYGRGSVLSGARSPVGVPPRLLLEMSEHLRPASGQASWDAAACA